MERCTLCPVACGADRSKRAGYCGVKGMTVAKYCLHAYEEPAISPGGKSGAVFFGGCALKCVFCQNAPLSRAQRGAPVSPHELAELFRRLEDAGAENIDLVTPDHVAHLIAEALSLYRPSVPVVYNSSGYCKEEALALIEPFVDVWMPDLKFVSPSLSLRYTGREDYFFYAKRAIARMAKTPVKRDAAGKLTSGILVRHLVLPMCTGDSLAVLDFLKQTLPPDAPLSIMRQYTPMPGLKDFPELTRRVTAREYRRVVDHALSLGFSELYTQDQSSAQASFIPDWDA